MELREQLTRITQKRFALPPEKCGSRELYTALLELTQRLTEEHR